MAFGRALFHFDADISDVYGVSSVTAHGNVALSTDRSRFGSKSLKLQDGAGNFAELTTNAAWPDVVPGSSMTIEIYIPTGLLSSDYTSNYESVMIAGLPTAIARMGSVYGFVNDDYDGIVGSIPLNQWVQIGVSNSLAGVTTCYVNGNPVSSGPTWPFVAFPGNSVSLVGVKSYAAVPLYTSELRIAFDQTLPATFTRPTAPYTDTTPSFSPTGNSPALLLHFDGDVVDAAGNTVVAAGTGSFTTSAAARFGSAGGIIPNGALFVLCPDLIVSLSAPATFEFFFKTLSTGVGYTLGLQCGQFGLAISDTQIGAIQTGNPSYALFVSDFPPVTVTQDVLHHGAMSSDGTTVRFYVDSTLRGSAAPNSAALANVGRMLSIAPLNNVGVTDPTVLIDEVCYTPSCKYTGSTITVPTAPLGNTVTLPTSPCIGVDAAAAIWCSVVRVGGTDVSDLVIGEIRIEGDEGTARIAEFSLLPASGTVLNLPGWTGLAVEIDVADNSTGTPQNAVRLFTGVVDTPALDLAVGKVVLRCTDDLQGRCDALTVTAINTLIGGYGSPAVFNAADTGWKHAQNRLSTVAASLDISPTGDLRVTSWTPKTTADFLLNEDVLGDHSLVPEIADRSGLINDVLVDFDYRFPRVKAECHVVDYTWIDMTGFSQAMIDGKSFMQRAQVEAAISKAGGSITSISYVALPTQTISLGSNAYWSPGPYDSTLCMGFAAGVTFDYTQTIEEQHRIHVRNAASITAVGTQPSTLSGALEGVYPDLSATETNIKLFKDAVSSIPPIDVAPALEGKTNAVEATLTPESNRAAANAAMETLIAIAKVRILASHRRNRISATVPLIPVIDLDKTIRIVADGVLAQGKCASVVHRMNAETGDATTDFSIALCVLSGVGITHPEGPTTAPTGTTAGNTALVASTTVTFNGTSTGDRTLTIVFPEVTSANRNNAVSEIDTVIAAPINEDLFTVTI